MDMKSLLKVCKTIFHCQQNPKYQLTFFCIILWQCDKILYDKSCNIIIQSVFIILDRQFLRSKNGDRFFFTHKDQAGSFTKEGRQILIDRTLSGVICDNTAITDVPEDAFRLTDPSKFISCDYAPKIEKKEILELLKFTGGMNQIFSMNCYRVLLVKGLQSQKPL